MELPCISHAITSNSTATVRTNNGTTNRGTEFFLGSVLKAILQKLDCVTFIFAGFHDGDPLDEDDKRHTSRHA